MAGRPKDPTVNKKIYREINRLLETTHFRDITIDQIAENTGISKATISVSYTHLTLPTTPYV